MVYLTTGGPLPLDGILLISLKICTSENCTSGNVLIGDFLYKEFVVIKVWGQLELQDPLLKLVLGTHILFTQ